MIKKLPQKPRDNKKFWLLKFVVNIISYSALADKIEESGCAQIGVRPLADFFMKERGRIEADVNKGIAM